MAEVDVAVGGVGFDLRLSHFQGDEHPVGSEEEGEGQFPAQKFLDQGPLGFGVH